MLVIWKDLDDPDFCQHLAKGVRTGSLSISDAREINATRGCGFKFCTLCQTRWGTKA